MAGLDAESLSIAERSKFASRSKRKIANEVAMILTVGFALIMVIQFFFGPYTFLRVAALTGAPDFMVWVVSSFLFALALAVWHYTIAGPKIVQAREMQTAIVHHEEAVRRREIQEKMDRRRDER